MWISFHSQFRGRWARPEITQQAAEATGGWRTEGMFLLRKAARETATRRQRQRLRLHLHGTENSLPQSAGLRRSIRGPSDSIRTPTTSLPRGSTPGLGFMLRWVPAVTSRTWAPYFPLRKMPPQEARFSLTLRRGRACPAAPSKF